LHDAASAELGWVGLCLEGELLRTMPHQLSWVGLCLEGELLRTMPHQLSWVGLSCFARCRIS
jgi:hypothetical protein